MKWIIMEINANVIKMFEKYGVSKIYLKRFLKFILGTGAYVSYTTNACFCHCEKNIYKEYVKTKNLGSQRPYIDEILNDMWIWLPNRVSPERSIISKGFLWVATDEGNKFWQELHMQWFEKRNKNI